MADPIRPKDLPAAPSVPTSASIMVDNGVTVDKVTPIQVVDAAIPLASQADAEAGVDNAKRVSALRVKQAIDSQAVTTPYQTGIPAEPSRFPGADAAAKLASAIAAQAGKTVTVVTPGDTTALPADYTGAALDYAADREGRWTHTSDKFGKARRTLKAQHPAHAGKAMATLHIETEAVGNTNGPANADYGQSIAVVKKGFGTGLAAGGEIDGLTIFVRQDGIQDSAFAATDRSDAAGILINAQKVGTCGWLGAIELGASELDPDTFAINRQVQAAVGVITGVEDNKAYGFTAAAMYGACDYGVLAYEDSGSGGTWQGLGRAVKANGTEFLIGISGDLSQKTSAWTNWSWRLTRPDNTDAPLSLEQRGTGGILISASDAADITFATNSVNRAQFTEAGHLIPITNLGVNLGGGANRFSEVYAYQLNMGESAVDGATWTSLGGAPEGLLSAPVGSLVVNKAGDPGQRVMFKASGVGNTGWIGIDSAIPSLKSFPGVSGNGIDDDSDGIEAALMSGLPIDVGDGQFVITRTINALHPLRLMGGCKSVLIFRNLAGADGINLLHTGSAYGQETIVGGFDVVLEGSDGGTFLKTPEGSAARALLPKYTVHSIRWHDPAALPANYGWEWAAELGEGDAHTFTNCEYYGSYNPANNPDATNTRSGFVRLGGTPGTSGTGYPLFDTCRVLNAGTVVKFDGALVARAKFDKLTVHDCWDGVVSSLTSSEPFPHEVTFIDCDINTQHRSIDFEYVSQFVAMALDTTRAPGKYDHAQGWTGIRVGYTGNLTIKGGRALDPNTGVAYTAVHKGFVGRANNLDIDGFIVRASSAGQFTTALDIGHCARGRISAIIDGAITTGVNLNTADASPSLKLEGMSYSSNVVTKVARSGTYNNANSPEPGLIRPRDSTTTTYTAAASVAVDVRTSAFKRVLANAGAAPYTVDFTISLAGAERDDEVWFDITLGGANPTVLIKDDTGATQVTLSPPGSGNTKRYSVGMVLVGGNNGTWRRKTANEQVP